MSAGSRSTPSMERPNSATTTPPICWSSGSERFIVPPNAVAVAPSVRKTRVKPITNRVACSAARRRAATVPPAVSSSMLMPVTKVT